MRKAASLREALGLCPQRHATATVVLWKKADAARKLKIMQNRMAHASEIINGIARFRLRYREVPVTIRYSEYSLSKGQKLTGSVNILVELLVGWLGR